MKVSCSLFGWSIYHFESGTFQRELVCFSLSNFSVCLSFSWNTIVIEPVSSLRNLKLACNVQCHYVTDLCKYTLYFLSLFTVRLWFLSICQTLSLNWPPPVCKCSCLGHKQFFMFIFMTMFIFQGAVYFKCKRNLHHSEMKCTMEM